MGDRKKIGYLLGAGASANKVPIVSQFEKVLKQYLATVSEFKLKVKGPVPPFNSDLSYENAKKEYISDINWLIEGVKHHYSIDTFARKLYLQGDYNNYRKLKLLLNEFLIYIEHTQGVDKRYDAFFAALLDKDSHDNLVLPDFTMFTWNYDRQAELSLAQFMKKSTKAVGEEFTFLPRDAKSKNVDQYSDGFMHVKLNGSSGYLEYKNEIGSLEYDYDLVGTDENKRYNLLYKSIDRHYNGINFIQGPLIKDEVADSYKFDPMINFSWENPGYTDGLRKLALNKATSIEILVVIGYSFPTFNRKLDSDLLQAMVDLEKIYLQIPPENIDEVQQRLEPLLSPQQEVQIDQRSQTGEFYIPFEM